MCCHYQRIAKRVFTRLWDTLSNSQRATVAADVEQSTEIAKWFYKAVETEAKAKFESPTYWLNDPFSFKYPTYELNAA